MWSCKGLINVSDHYGKSTNKVELHFHVHINGEGDTEQAAMSLIGRLKKAMGIENDDQTFINTNRSERLLSLDISGRDVQRIERARNNGES